jgi:hypothetical protein
MWKEAVGPKCKVDYYIDIHLEGQRKTTKISIRIAGLLTKI